jgi:hypothetical protein
MTPTNPAQPDLPLNFEPVMDFNEHEDWPMPPGGPIPDPALREPRPLTWFERLMR